MYGIRSHKLELTAVGHWEVVDEFLIKGLKGFYPPGIGVSSSWVGVVKGDERYIPTQRKTSSDKSRMFTYLGDVM